MYSVLLTLALLAVVIGVHVWAWFYVEPRARNRAELEDRCRDLRLRQSLDYDRRVQLHTWGE